MKSINSGIGVAKLDVTYAYIIMHFIHRPHFLNCVKAGYLRDFVSLYGLLCIMNG